jgi:anaerobic magnesium-protoporphyrin IX monomethyl ester cyclase
MRILFIDASSRYLGRHASSSKVAPLIGMAYVASFLEAQHHDVRVFDAMISARKGRRLEDELAEFRPQLVALGATTPFVPDSFDAARLTRRILPGTLVVLGGPHATSLPARSLAECTALDYVVSGESEYALAELVTALQEGGRPGGIAGVLGRHEAAASLRARPLEHRPDVFPFPDWSLYDMSAYDRVYSHLLGSDETLFQVLLSRGCPYACTFCAGAFGSSYRVRSAESVAAEIDLAYDRYGARLFDFVDPTMTLHKARFLDLCRELGRSRAAGRIAWSFETRADLVSDELLCAAREAGCECVLFGTESGSQTVLDAMRKGISKEQNQQAIESAVRAGLRVKVTLIVGHPFETRDTIEETIRYAREIKKLQGVEVLPAFLGVYPGTGVYEMVERGDGGARWSSGVREDWRRMFRDRPNIEVGDLDGQALIGYMAELRSAIAG